jgi:TNF receptor-associated protein 1
MVAKSVKVYSHSWKADEPGHVWSSDGSGSYEIEEAADLSRGTKIVIELKDDCAEFARREGIKDILERYSAFVSFPINLNGKRVNTVQALWLRSKNEIKDEEYTEFYKFQAHAFDEPRLRLHFSADAPLSINALLFVPKENTEKLGFARLEPASSLYCRKVLIDAKPKDLLPEWLRFLKGVVDSEDLPLNISRETMQDKALIEKLNKVITKRFLKFLEEEAKNRVRRLQRSSTRVRHLPEGGRRDRLHPQGPAHQAAPLRVLPHRQGQDHLPRRLRLAHGLRAEGNLLPRRPEPRRPRKRPVSGRLQGPQPRGALLLRARRRIRDEQRPRVRRQEAHRRRPRRREARRHPEARGRPPRTTPRKLAAWLKESLGERVAEVKASDRLVDSPALALNADKFMSPTCAA